MNKTLTIQFKDFSRGSELAHYLKDCTYETVEIEFTQDELINAKERALFKNSNTPFNGYCYGYFTTQEFTESKLILKRKYIKDLITRLEIVLERHLKDESFFINSTRDLTKEISYFIDLFKETIEISLKDIIKSGLSSFYYRGVRFDCCNFKLDFKEDKIFLTKSLVCDYAVEFFNSRNTPKLRLFSIDKKAIKNQSTISKEVCSLLEEIPYKDYHTKLSKLGIKEKRIYVLTENDFDSFYSIGSKYAINLTDTVVNNWWNAGCVDDIVKYTVNEESVENWLGLYSITFEEVLVGAGPYSNFVSDDITEEEYNCICKGDRKETSIANSILHKLNARSLTEHDKIMINAKLNELENHIQDLINENKEELTLKTAIKVLDYDVNTLENFSLEKLSNLLDSVNTGFDCGFVHFKFKDKELSELFDKAESVGLRTYSLNIDLPILLQSTILQADMASSIVDLINKELGIELMFWTNLD